MNKELIKTINNLYNKYNDNIKVKNELNHYITTLLPNHLENIKNIDNIHKREINDLSAEFLNQNKIFYIEKTDIFILYDDINYLLIKEDVLYHKIFNKITNYNNLRNLKFDIIDNIIKLIKSNKYTDAIPESTTIQNTLQFLFPLFNTKEEIKYFLTIIGDLILQKNNNLTFFILSKNIKQLLNIIETKIYYLFDLHNICNKFKYKFHEHSFNSSRIININSKAHIELSYDHDNDHLYINKNILNLIFVACHYSDRYNNSDGFLENCTNQSLIENATFLKVNSVDTIINNFISDSIQNCNNSYINNKDMLYLWKLYLEELNIPNIIFHNNFKKKIINLLEYDNDNDIFLNITSVKLPFVSNFLKFWEENIQICDIDENKKVVFEIDEILLLYKKYNPNIKNYFNDIKLINLINFYFNDVIIKDNKYIINIFCNLCDKNKDIIDSIHLYKDFSINQIKNNIKNIFTLYDAYKFYLDLYKSNIIISNKKYFEEIAINYIHQSNINNFGIIHISWFNI